MGNDNEPAEEVVIIAKGQERKGMSTAAIEIRKFVSKKKKCLHCGDEFEERASGRQNQ
jgi:dTDP-glucose pyrophosphorylase